MNTYKDGKVCAVFYCHNYGWQRDAVSFFRFPRDKDICAHWVNKCRRSDLDEIFKTHGPDRLNKSHRICAKHFKTSDFRNPKLTSQGLKKNVVPSLLLSPPNEPVPQKRHTPKKRCREDDKDISEPVQEMQDNPSEAMDYSTEEILPDIKPDISTLGILEPSVDESLQEDNKNFVKALTIDSGKCPSVSSIANHEESTVEPCEDVKPIIISVVGSINETTEHIRSTMTSVDAIPVNLPVPVSETQEDSGPSSMPLLNATNESCKILLEGARTSVACTETVDVPPVAEDGNKHLYVSVSSKNTPPSVTSSLSTAMPIVNPPLQPKLDIDILREIKQASDAFQRKANKFMAKQINLMEKQIENQNIIIQLLKQQANGLKFSHL